VRKSTKKQRKFRHVGIMAAAQELGVSVNHLWMVLRGQRRSPRIENSEWFRRTVAAKREFEKTNK